MSGSNDEDNSRGDNWPWNDHTFQNMQSEHERFMNQLKEESRRFQRSLDNEVLPTSSASSSDSSSSSPFATFKKFIDDNFNTVTESFRNLPSNISEVRARMQAEQEARKQEELAVSQRWTGSFDSPDHIRMEVERSTPEEQDAVREATMLLLKESWRRNENVSAEKIIALFADHQSSFGGLDRFASPMLSWGGACYYMPETGDNLPSTRSWCWTSAPALRWLSVDWFKRSPYSPITLEAHPDACVHGTKWRAAFEDLLNAALDKPMQHDNRIGQRSPYGTVQYSLHRPGLDWMLSLQCRGILPPQLPRLYNDIWSDPEMRRKSIRELLDQHHIDTPWSKRCSFPFRDPLSQDFADLMSVVGIKSSPETQQQPVPAPQEVLTTDSPATEQDLYEFAFASAAAATPTLAVFKESIMQALDENNRSAVEKILDGASQCNSDLRDIIDDTLQQLVKLSHQQQSPRWTFTLLQALEECESEIAEQAYTQKAIETLDRLLELDESSFEEKHRRQTLIQHLEDTLSDDFNHARTFMMSTDEIEEYIEAKEQEADNLSKMTGEKDLVKEESIPKSVPVVVQEKPGVLSALTTTHTVRLPDGTVTTKVVLKQRFADGREETHESVHTSHESATDEKEEKQSEEKKKKKKGWFWY